MLFALGAGAAAAALGLLYPPVLVASQGAFWFLAKVFLFLYAFIWFRGTFPRYRFDQLMRLGWHFMIRVAIVNVIFCGLGLVLSWELGWNRSLSLLLASGATLLVAAWLARGRS